jgi:MSHA biogenesis protein MshG
MPVFQYSARGDGGKAVSGQLEAVSASAAALRLESSGLLPIRIAPRIGQDFSLQTTLRKAGFGKPTTTDLVLFTRQMYTIAKAGLPWLRGLRSLQETTRNPVLRATLEQALVSLEGGRDLSQSLAESAAVFPELYISMVRVGEQTGTLETVFLRLAEYLHNQQEMRTRVRGAMRYPLIVVGAIVAAMAVLSVFVIPKFAPLFKQLGDALPVPTRIILASSNFVQLHWAALLGVVLAAVIAFMVTVRTGPGRYRWHRMQLALPVFGPLLLQSILARTVRTLSLTLEAGLPMIQALDLIARAADNDHITAKIIGMREQLESGEPLSRAALAAKIFPPLLLQMMEIGEETGEMTRLLDEVALYFQREVDYTLDNLSALIEPVLLVIVGAMVLTLALGIFLPLWEMIGKVAGPH